ncbi:MAG: nickel ABC transporter substrate-binding protein [Clostridium sp.]|jgi:peptide/nickel transport system substrate-binding protein|uniref:nickel ABC transporter substrate-binding protein n=1 Tax=Clostridium sp. TaxID=1506 RepID=UPI0025BD23D4|nr:nickel ABC transporter substrate-binding protein [Clostridium sp.]MCH3963771.1 nickel ABC transporter substrate-binding protein [Clostridium sp.]MCI1714912.1 nickel ABC transporter substrate-binding protein [Clostridium sp.]MCI1798899.1 nickel ABC transporter substrate-binding protein [Clostridium sp.]MCI1813095.1 nickel ABC transporter substrate-binding protein [Clostridium sp.]MCI1869985.1 nickel ABC transporter substrate-binding protein [Clostridium sp.]
MRKIKSYIILSILCIFTLLISSCSSKEEAVQKQQKKEIIVAIAGDGQMNKLDAATYNGPHPIYKMIYEGLVEDAGTKGIQPQLATEWHIADDGRTYTFKLRKGVKFSDGTDFDSNAVIFNLKRWVNNQRYASLTAVNVTKMEAVDKYTVKIVFKDKAYPILTELSYPRPVRFLSPKSIQKIEGNPAGKFIKPVGTGPWMLESYTRDKEFSLVPNPYYWGEKPKIDRIVFKVIPDGQARVMALQSGEVDIIGGELLGKVPLDSINTLKSDKNFKIYNSETRMSEFITFNYDNSNLQDKNVRLAINYAIDKSSMVDKLLNGIGKPAEGLFQNGVPYVTKQNSKGYGYDSKRSKELLAQSGYKDGNGDGIVEKDGKPLEFNMVLSTDAFPEWKSMSEFIQSQLSAVGIKVNLNTVDSNTLTDIAMNTRKFDLLMQRTSSDSWVPHSDLKQDFIKTGTTNNKARVWYNEKLEKNINSALESMDEKIRQENYDRVFKFIHDEAICAPLYYPETTFAVSSKVIGFKTGVNSYDPIQWSKLDIAEN